MVPLVWFVTWVRGGVTWCMASAGAAKARTDARPATEPMRCTQRTFMRAPSEPPDSLVAVVNQSDFRPLLAAESDVVDLSVLVPIGTRDRRRCVADREETSVRTPSTG